MAYSRYGSSYGTDPNFQTEEVQRAGAALSQIALTLRQSQDRQELQREAEIERFMREAAALPSLASSPWAADLVSRAGQHAPEVQAVIGALKNREQIVDQRKSAYQKLLDNADQIQQHRTAIKAQLTGSPDYIPAADGIGPPAPNAAKQQATDYLAQTEGMGVWSHALDSMTPSEQVAARQAWKEAQGSKGGPGAASELELPTPINFKDMPPAAKAAVLMRAGQYPGQISNVVDNQLLADPGFQDQLRQREKLSPSQRDAWLNKNKVGAAEALAQNRKELAASQAAAASGRIAQEARAKAGLQKAAQNWQQQLYDMGVKGNMIRVPDPIASADLAARTNLDEFAKFYTPLEKQMKDEKAAIGTGFVPPATKARWAQIQQQIDQARVSPLGTGAAGKLVAGPGGVYDQVSRGILDPNSAWDEIGQMVSDYQAPGAGKTPEERLSFALAGSHQRRFQATGQAKRSQVYSQTFGATKDPSKALSAAFGDQPGKIAPLMAPAAAREMMRKAHARGMTPIPAAPTPPSLTPQPQPPTVTIPDVAGGGGDSEE